MEIGIVIAVIALIYLSLKGQAGAARVRTIAINGSIFILFLAPPLVAEWWTATPSNVPGTGFSLLLYEPFDFAYVLLTTISFVAANLLPSNLRSSSKGTALAGSIGWAVAWFITSFFSVAQLHLSLGGQM